MTRSGNTAHRNSSHLPAGWRWVRLKDALGTLESGGRPRGGVYGIQSGHLSLGAEHISEFGTLHLKNPRFIPHAFFAALRAGKIQRRDILLVKDGATTGRVAFLDDELGEGGAAVNEHVFLLRPKEGIDAFFLFLALLSPDGQKAIRRCYRGSAQGGITRAFARSVWIPLPSRPEQDIVSSKLRAQLATAEHLRRIAERQVNTTLQVRAGLVAQAMCEIEEVQGHLGVVLASPPKTGWSPPCDDKTGGTPVLTLSAILHFRYDGSQVKLTSAPVDASQDYWVKKGDLFISRSNTPELVGHAAICDGTPERAIFSDLLIRLDIDATRADTRFVYYWLMAPTIRAFIARNARGSSGTMKKITLEMIREMPFPEISVQQQQRIVQSIAEREPHAAVVRSAAERQQEAINALPGALLGEVFGHFEPPDEEQ